LPPDDTLASFLYSQASIKHFTWAPHSLYGVDRLRSSLVPNLVVLDANIFCLRTPVEYFEHLIVDRPISHLRWTNFTQGPIYHHLHLITAPIISLNVFLVELELLILVPGLCDTLEFLGTMVYNHLDVRCALLHLQKDPRLWRFV
jgi:hypothetical protein